MATAKKITVKEATAKKAATPKRAVPGRNGGTLNPIQPGETRNPNGRPKSARYMTDLIKDALDGEQEIIIEGVAETDAKAGEKVKVRVKMPTHLQIIQALLRKAAKGDNKAIEMVMDRVEGKVPFSIGGDPEHPLLPEGALPQLTPELITRLEKAIGSGIV